MDTNGTAWRIAQPQPVSPNLFLKPNKSDGSSFRLAIVLYIGRSLSIVSSNKVSSSPVESLLLI